MTTASIDVDVLNQSIEYGKKNQMANEVMLMISIQTKPGRGEEQVAAFRQLAPVVRAETGCLQYDLHPVAGDKDRFVLLERWASQEALAAHDVTPHMIAADAHSPAFRAGPATVLQLDATSVA